MKRNYIMRKNPVFNITGENEDENLSRYGKFGSVNKDKPKGKSFGKSVKDIVGDINIDFDLGSAERYWQKKFYDTDLMRNINTRRGKLSDTTYSYSDKLWKEIDKSTPIYDVGETFYFPAITEEDISYQQPYVIDRIEPFSLQRPSNGKKNGFGLDHPLPSFRSFIPSYEMWDIMKRKRRDDILSYIHNAAYFNKYRPQETLAGLLGGPYTYYLRRKDDDYLTKQYIENQIRNQESERRYREAVERDKQYNEEQSKKATAEWQATQQYKQQVNDEINDYDREQRIWQRAEELRNQGYEVNVKEDGKIEYSMPNKTTKSKRTPKTHKPKEGANIFYYPHNTNVQSSAMGYTPVKHLEDGTIEWIDTDSQGRKVKYHTEKNGRLLDYTYALGGGLRRRYF